MDNDQGYPQTIQRCPTESRDGVIPAAGEPSCVHDSVRTPFLGGPWRSENLRTAI